MQSLKAHLGAISGLTDTPAQILTKIKSVDGEGSGLDSDFVKGNDLIDGSGNISANTVTASSFVGDGSGLTGLSAGVTTGKAIAMAMVFG